MKDILKVEDCEKVDIDYINISRFADGVAGKLDYNNSFEEVNTLFGNFRNFRVAFDYLTLENFPEAIIGARRLKKRDLLIVNKLNKAHTKNPWAIMVHIIWERFKNDVGLAAELCLYNKDIKFTSFNYRMHEYADNTIGKRSYNRKFEKYIKILNDIFLILKEYATDTSSKQINIALINRNIDEIDSKVRALMIKHKSTKEPLLDGLPFDIDLSEIDYRVNDKHISEI